MAAMGAAGCGVLDPSFGAPSGFSDADLGAEEDGADGGGDIYSHPESRWALMSFIEMDLPQIGQSTIFF